MRKRLFFFALLLGISMPAWAAETIMLALYNDFSPWYNADGSGLNAELAARLTDMSNGKYQFVARVIPRRRLNAMLAAGEAMVVPWVSPRFFGDDARTKYLWSDALLSDVSYFVSPASAPLEYTGPASLYGKRFSASSGHVYGDLTALIEAGKIAREDAPTLRESLMKLVVASRKLDFAVIDRSTLIALQDEPFVQPSQLHLSRQLRTELFTRHILVPKRHPEWLRYLNQALAQLRTDKTWMDKMHQFGAEGELR